MSDNVYNNLMNNFQAFVKSNTPKPNEAKPSIDEQVLANMKTHYSSIMKAGALDFGGNSISMSIFSKIDTDGNNVLSESEVANANLDVVIKNTVEEYHFKSYLNETFGETYTEQAKQTDPNSEKSTTEQIIDNNIKDVCAQILDYAEQHPDDELVQQYANELKTLLDNNGVIGTNVVEKHAIGEHLAADSLHPKGSILIDNHDRLNNLDKRILLNTILHELGHAITNDNLDSFAEEHDVESIARELALEISGQEIFHESMEEFISAYKGLPVASPGTYNIPLNAGITTKYEPQEVIMEDNILTIRSGVNEDGNRVEDHVTFGTETDDNGNPLPVSAERVIIDAEGKTIFSMEYGDYNKLKKAFNDRAKVDVKQLMFENKLKGKSDFFDSGFN